MTLETLGWTPFFSEAFQKLTIENLVPARIFRQDRQRYVVVDDTGERSATVLGRLLHAEETDLPAVGDWVAIQPFDEEQAVIHHVLPRFSVFLRKEAGPKTRRQVVAANVDTVFLVSGLDNDFNVRRIERYLLQAAGSGARPVIVLNKKDLCDDLEARIAEVKRVGRETEIIALSAVQGDGINALLTAIKPGETVAFLGSSGVGKSSIVNRLMGHDQLKTGEVRADDSRGRHTTSHRELLLLPAGGLVMDTPGMRELQLWGDENDLQAVFSDIDELAENCRFRDCVHDTEPGCALREAVDNGELDEDRFLSYMKLKRELAYLDRRMDEAAHLKAKKREKYFGKLVKEINKRNPKR